MDRTPPLAEIVLDHAERAVVRLGDDVYVKVDTDHARLDREVVAMRAMAARALRVPEVLWSRPGLLAISAVPGRPLALYGQPSPFDTDAWWRAGAVARSIHSTPAPAGATSVFAAGGLPAWIDAERQWLLDDGRVEPAVVHARAEHAHRYLDGRAEARAYCHGDLQCEHVLVDADGSIAVIDWGDAGCGDPAYDLAVLTVGNTERLDDVLAGYGPADLVDREVISAYWSLRRLGSVHWMLAHGYEATADIAALSVWP